MYFKQKPTTSVCSSINMVATFEPRICLNCGNNALPVPFIEAVFWYDQVKWRLPPLEAQPGSGPPLPRSFVTSTAPVASVLSSAPPSVLHHHTMLNTSHRLSPRLCCHSASHVSTSANAAQRTRRVRTYRLRGSWFRSQVR